jgi:transposase-like protein
MDDKPVNKPYRKLQIDELPILELEKLDYRQLLVDYFLKHNKNLKPVKPHKNSKSIVPSNITCPKCSAPHIYLYDNTGGRGQYLCKVCRTTFNKKNRFSKSAVLRCPHCLHVLVKIKKRNEFDVYKCKNRKCSFYLNNLKSMSKQDRKEFKENPQDFKLHYIYRAFNFDYKPLSKESPILPKVDLSKLYCNTHTLGLILTFHVNYGMSARKTACIMKDIYGVNISHQTILNYCEAVATVVKPFIDNFNYSLSNSFCGDETYIKVNGKWQYIFFFFDAVKKIILSYRVSPNRDTLSAVKALDDVLSKLPSIPDDLTFVVDGNPIYLLAMHYFAQHDIHFNVEQVIGLTNDDPVSKELRPLKQIIERLNRTFKGNYRSTHGFQSNHGSISFVTLFAAYFNFLRPHSALEKRVPVIIPQLETLPHMPARWGKLIELSQEYIQNNQCA